MIETGNRLASIDTWVFDLDNTLYPAECDLFSQVEIRMTTYISRLLQLSQVQAQAIRKQMFFSYGTTLNGLMAENGIDPDEYLDFVHDIDLTPLVANPELDEALGALAGRKLIFTNASSGHAKAVLARLGIAHHFSGIYDIKAAEFVPKPAMPSYRRFLQLYQVAPEKTVMVEDMARNLEPAAALGMVTVWVETRVDWARQGAEQETINYRTADLPAFLSSVARAAGRFPGSPEQ